VTYIPDFVLAPQDRILPHESRRIRQRHLRGLVHVECKPTVEDPQNLLQLVPAPVVLLCGYPHDSPHAFVVSTRLEFRGRKQWRVEGRVFHPYGSDWQQAVIDAATGDWRERPSVERIGVEKVSGAP
jgi:hypothetical protein